MHNNMLMPSILYQKRNIHIPIFLVYSQTSIKLSYLWSIWYTLNILLYSGYFFVGYIFFILFLLFLQLVLYLSLQFFYIILLLILPVIVQYFTHMVFFLLSYIFIIIVCFLPANLQVIVLFTFFRFFYISLVCILYLKSISLLSRYMSSSSITALVSFYLIGITLYAPVIILRYFA